MKQQVLSRITKAIKTGVPAGALFAVSVYGFVRLLFYEFTFSAWEEVVNFFMIIAAGAFLVSMAIMCFLMLELLLQYFNSIKISLPSLSWETGRKSEDVIKSFK